MRTGCRILGLILAGLAAVLLALDLDRLVQSGRFNPTDVGALWYLVHPESLQLLQPAVERHIHPFLWDPITITILLSPAFLVFGVLAILLLMVGQRRGRRSRRFGS